MAYTAQISRSDPTCFLFLIDQSASMSDPIGGEAGTGGSRRKADVVADAINRFLQELSIKCAKEEGVRDYFQIGVIGYGARVGPAFGGVLSGRDLVPISEVASSPARIEERSKKVDDGAGGLLDQPIKFPVWFDPIADDGTPMCEALGQGQRILNDWLNEHLGSFPPVVIHFTDGESTDGDPSMPAESIRSLMSADGNVLLFNCHISSDQASSVRLPGSEESLPNEFARLLFRMSSHLPQQMRDAAQQLGYDASEGTRGFVFNAEITDVVQFLDIGTRTTQLR
jgi:hypothetical protein